MCDLKDREEAAEWSGLSSGGGAGFLEGIASPPAGNPYSKNVNCPVLQQLVNSILSGLTINSAFSTTSKFDG